ncbi:hypothetical protein ABPG72_005081 [Tetrahymena utriculariae]
MEEGDEFNWQTRLETIVQALSTPDQFRRRSSAIQFVGQFGKKTNQKKNMLNSAKEIPLTNRRMSKKFSFMKKPITFTEDGEQEQDCIIKKSQQKRKVTIVANDNPINEEAQQQEVSQKEILLDEPQITNIEKIKDFIKQTNFDQLERKRKNQVECNDSFKQIIDDIVQVNILKQKQLEKNNQLLVHISNAQNENFNESIYSNPDFTKFQFQKFKNILSSKFSQQINEIDFNKQNYIFNEDPVLEERLMFIPKSQQKTNLYRKKNGILQNSETIKPLKADFEIQHSINKFFNFSRRNQKLQMTQQDIREELQSYIEKVKIQIDQVRDKQEAEIYYEQTLKMMENRTMQTSLDIRKKLHDLQQANCSINKTNESLESELNAVRLQKKLIRFKKNQINEELNERDQKYTETLNQQNIKQIEVESELVVLIKEYEEFSKKEKEVTQQLNKQQEEIQHLEKEIQYKTSIRNTQQKQQATLEQIDFLITLKQYSDKMEKKLSNIQRSIQDSQVDEDVQPQNLEKNKAQEQETKAQALEKIGQTYTINVIQEDENQSLEKEKNQDQKQNQKSKISDSFIEEEKKYEKDQKEEIGVEELERIKLNEQTKNENNLKKLNILNNILNLYQNGSQLSMNDENEQKSNQKLSQNNLENELNLSISEDTNLRKDSADSSSSSSMKTHNEHSEEIHKESSAYFEDLDEKIHDTSIKVIQKNKNEDHLENWKESSISSAGNDNNIYSSKNLNQLTIKSGENSNYTISDFTLNSKEIIQGKEYSNEQVNSFSSSSVASSLVEDELEEGGQKNLLPIYNHNSEISKSDNNGVADGDANFIKSLKEKKIKSTRFVEDILNNQSIEKDKNLKLKKQKKQKSTKQKQNKTKKNKLRILKKLKNKSNHFKLDRVSTKGSQIIGSSRSLRQNSSRFINSKKKSSTFTTFGQYSQKQIQKEKEKILKQKAQRDELIPLKERVRQFMESIEGDIEICFFELTERFKRNKESLENLQIQQNKLSQRKKVVQKYLEELEAVPLEKPEENQTSMNSTQSINFDKNQDSKSFFKFKGNTFKSMNNLESKNNLEMKSRSEFQINEDQNQQYIFEIMHYKKKMIEREHLLQAEVYNIEYSHTLLKLNKAQRILSLFQQDLKIVHFRVSRVLSNLVDRQGNEALQQLLLRANNQILKLNERANSLLQRSANYVKTEFSQQEFQQVISLDLPMKGMLIQLFCQQGHIFDCITSVITYFFPYCSNSIQQFIYQFKQGYYLLRFCKKVDLLYYISLVQSSVMKQNFFQQNTEQEQKPIASKNSSSNVKFKLEKVISQLGIKTNLFSNEQLQKSSFKKLQLIKPLDEFTKEEQKLIDDTILMEFYNQFPNLLERAALNYSQIGIERTVQLIQIISTLQKLINDIKEKQKQFNSSFSQSSCDSQKQIKEFRYQFQKKQKEIKKQNQQKKQISGMSKKTSHLDTNDFQKLDQYDFNYGQDWQQRLNNLQIQAYYKNQIRRMNSYMGVNKYEEKESLLTIDDKNHIIKKNPNQINIKDLIKEQIYNLHYLNNPQTINLGEEYQNFTSLRKKIKMELQEKEKEIQEENQRKLEELKQKESSQLKNQNFVLQSLKRVRSEDSVPEINRSRQISKLWQKSLSPIRIINIFQKIPNKQKQLKKDEIIVYQNYKRNKYQSKDLQCISLDQSDLIDKYLKEPEKNTQTTNNLKLQNQEYKKYEQAQKITNIEDRQSPKRIQKQIDKEQQELINALKKIVHYQKDFKRAKQNGVEKFNKEVHQQKLEHNKSKKQNLQQGQDKQQQLQQTNQQDAQNSNNNIKNSSPQQQSQQNQQPQQSNSPPPPQNHLEKIKVKKQFVAYFKRKQYEKEKQLEDEVLKLYKHSDNYYQQRNQDINNLSMDDTYYNFLNINNKKNNEQQLPQLGYFQQKGGNKKDTFQYTSIWNIINKLQAQKKFLNIVGNNQINEDIPFNLIESEQNAILNIPFQSSPNSKRKSNAQTEQFNQQVVKVIKHKQNHKYSKSKSPTAKENLILSPNSPNIYPSSAATTAPRSLSPISSIKYSPITQSRFKQEQILPKIKSKNSSSSPLHKKKKKSLHAKIQNTNQI